MTTYHFCYTNKGKFHKSKPSKDATTVTKEAKRIASRFGFIVCVQSTKAGKLEAVAVYS